MEISYDSSGVRVHRIRVINDHCSCCRKEDGRERRQINKPLPFWKVTDARLFYHKRSGVCEVSMA